MDASDIVLIGGIAAVAGLLVLAFRFSRKLGCALLFLLVCVMVAMFWLIVSSSKREVASAGGSASAPRQLPEFPMPPPEPSAAYTLPRQQLGTIPTLGALDGRLRQALDAAGYSEPSYFAVRNGFALVSQMERITPDGASWPDPAKRWDVGPASLLPQDTGFIELLLQAMRPGTSVDPGRYRVVVFLVTSEEVVGSGKPPSPDEAKAWLREGGLRLPPQLASKAFTPEQGVYALIYDFKRPTVGARMELLRPSPLPARVHLRKAKLLPLPS